MVAGKVLRRRRSRVWGRDVEGGVGNEDMELPLNKSTWGMCERVSGRGGGGRGWRKAEEGGGRDGREGDEGGRAVGAGKGAQGAERVGCTCVRVEWAFIKGELEFLFWGGALFPFSFLFSSCI